MHHDDVLGRLTDGEGRLDSFTRGRAQARSVPRQRRAHDDLGDLCDLVGGRVTMLVELKSRFDGDGRLPARVAAVLAGYRGPVGADVIRSGAAQRCCGKSPLACRAALSRPNTGRIPIGI